MQPKLPDLNHGINYNRTQMWIHLNNGLFDTAVTFFMCINALLPDIDGGSEPTNNINDNSEEDIQEEEIQEEEESISYRLKFDDNYYEKDYSKRSYECKHCKKTTPIGEIKSFNMTEYLLPNYLSLLTKTKPVWRCPNCKKLSDYNNDYMVVTQHSSLRPFFHHVIPHPPPHVGIERAYQEKIRKWFRLAIPEIEERIGAYRSEYMAQIGDDDI